MKRKILVTIILFTILLNCFSTIIMAANNNVANNKTTNETNQVDNTTKNQNTTSQNKIENNVENKATNTTEEKSENTLENNTDKKNENKVENKNEVKNETKSENKIENNTNNTEKENKTENKVENQINKAEEEEKIDMSDEIDTQSSQEGRAIESNGVQYRTHVQYDGWQNWKSNGDVSGTSGRSLRLEGINIKLTGDIASKVKIKYQVHVQYDGWQSWKKDGEMAGTEGRSLRVEALNIKLINAPSNAGIIYRTHVQYDGWQDWKSNGQMAGTSGRSLRVEALEIKLQNMSNYTVEYQVHVQDYGWSGWYIDGETAGTVGQGKRIEAIRIRIVPKYKRNYSGIDVSEFNHSINWALVKRSGVEFAMIRVGYRGYGTEGNFKEEANWVINKLKGYSIDYPVAIDIERSAKPNGLGRADGLDKNTRTYLAKTFCQTIQSSGYTPLVYTNVDWATNKLDMSQLSAYDTWIASYKQNIQSGPSYNGKYAIWQHTSSGKIDGILGNVDLNICYKKY